jgi:group I intron endonuclease
VIIYKTTNLINGKFYVGKASKNSPEYLGSGVLLNVAIKKYGKENFKKEILEEVTSIENLDIREIYWINELNATDRNIGYNITAGGTGGNTYANNPNYDNIITNLKKRRHTEETKKKISENNWQSKNNGSRTGSKWGEDQINKMKDYYKNNPGSFKGKNHSEETKKKIRETKVGTEHSEETKQKMREAKVGIVLKDYTCPYCKKQGKGNAMKRFHFNNCKNKKDE